MSKFYEEYLKVFGDKPEAEPRVTIPLKFSANPVWEGKQITEGGVVYEGQNPFRMHLFTGTPDALYAFVSVLFSAPLPEWDLTKERVTFWTKDGTGRVWDFQTLPSKEDFMKLIAPYQEDQNNA